MEATTKGTRRWAASLVIGVVLLFLGALVALFGSIGGMLWSVDRIESMPTPTPDDLKVGSDVVRLALVAGLLIAAAGAVLLVTGLRSRARGRAEEADATPWR